MQLRPSIRLASSLAAALVTKMPSSSSPKPTLRGVIFNMDGTLTVPNLDVANMYARCKVPIEDDILETIANKMTTADAEHAWKVIDEVEEEGRRTLQLTPGARELGVWLQAHRVPIALVTRNSSQSAEYFARELWGADEFFPLVSRDSPKGLPTKPDPAAIHYIGKEWAIDMDSESLDLIMVGNTNDVIFGKRAGVSTALVNKVSNDGPDIHVEELRDLPRKLWETFHIESTLGTNVPLLKYPAPAPDGVASIAAFEGNIDCLHNLSLSELNSADKSGNTPLVWASDAGHTAVAKLLLSKGVDVNAQGYLGATAVCRASRRGNTDVLRLLLDHNASPDIPNKKMQYPLHFAAFKRNPEAVAELLEKGANPLVLDRKGRTPAQDTSDLAIRDMITKVATEIVARIL